MKLKFFYSLLFLTLLSCGEKSLESDYPSDKIKEVESNLVPAVFIEGDSTWSIEERMEHYGVTGASIAVIHNGEIAWTKAYGNLDKESGRPVTTETRFQAASISKPVTAYGALTLVEQGKIDLTADINSQLTEYQIGENEFTAEKKVNVKNLLNHSAGTTVHGFWGYSPDLPVPTLLQVLNGQAPANSDSVVVNKVPEESYRYSGGGYNIVQQLMIEVEGKTFSEIMSENVLQPLGMTHSTYSQPLPDSLLKDAPTGYLPDGTMVNGRRHTYPEMAPAGLWTTPEDLAKFAINLQETIKGISDKGLSQSMTKTMLTPFVSDDFGIGIALPNKNGEQYFGHSGWNEGFSSDMVAHKDKGYGAVVMINSNHPAFIDELIRAVALTYDWDNYFSQYEPVQDATPLSDKAHGKYIVRGFDYIEVSMENGELMYRDGPEENLTKLVQVSDSTFVIRDADILFQFIQNKESGMMDAHVLNPSTMEAFAVFGHQVEGEQLPIELVMTGDYVGALNKYKAIQKANSEDPNVNEDNLNMFGYRFMGADQPKVAKDIFAVNMVLHPESFNVYDSYAEACMMLEENEEAVENYKKSLELNPENINAQITIERILKGD